MSAINRYLLMNKDNQVASFALTEQYGEDVFILEAGYDAARLPIGFSDINSWVDGRKACQHNAHLKEIMTKLGCVDRLGFVRMTHAASINDTFWVKREDESACWRDISLYTNQFTETISRLAFEGVGLYDEVFSSISPELVTEGSFKKCFKKEDNGIFIYKRGSDLGVNSGLEPYCEMMASEIAGTISPNAVKYELVTLHDTLASKCALFTDESKGYVSFARYIGHNDNNTLTQLFSEAAKNGCEDKVKDMLVIDSLVFNQDRHKGNYGFLFDNDSLKIMDFAPVFDLNLSLFVYAMKDEFEKVGDLLSCMGPKLGSDFTRIGQIGLRDATADRIKDLRDFEFSFKGDDKFEPWRVKAITELVQRQATAILSKETLYTKDVFIPETPLSVIPHYDRLVAMAHDAAQYDELTISECIDSKNVLISYSFMDNVNEYELTLDYVNNGITYSVDGQEGYRDEDFYAVVPETARISFRKAEQGFYEQMKSFQSLANENKPKD